MGPNPPHFLGRAKWDTQRHCCPRSPPAPARSLVPSSPLLANLAARFPPPLSQPLRFCPAPRGHAKQMSTASGFVPEDCRVVSPRLRFLQTEPSQFLPRWYFLNSELFLLFSSVLFPPPPPESLYPFEGVLPKTGRGIGDEQGRRGCHTDRAPVAVRLIVLK